MHSFGCRATSWKTPAATSLFLTFVLFFGVFFFVSMPHTDGGNATLHGLHVLSFIPCVFTKCPLVSGIPLKARSSTFLFQRLQGILHVSMLSVAPTWIDLDRL